MRRGGRCGVCWRRIVWRAISVVYKVLDEVEEQVIFTYGISRDEYFELLKEYSKQSYIKVIQETTQQLIQTTLKGKTHKISVSIQGNLTLSVHCKAYRRFLAARRQLAYIELRHIGNKGEIFNDEELAKRVYKHYDMKEVEDKMDRYSFVLRRATYAFKCSEAAEGRILAIERENSELAKLIEENWVIPDMEKDVMALSDEELKTRIETQLEYVNKFVYPRKKSLD